MGLGTYSLYIVDYSTLSPKHQPQSLILIAKKTVNDDVSLVFKPVAFVSDKSNEACNNELYWQISHFSRLVSILVYRSPDSRPNTACCSGMRKQQARWMD